MGELRRRLEYLSGRGEPRGAARVWQDATTDPVGTGGRRVQPAAAFLALLAAVALVGTTVVNLAGSGSDGPSGTAALIAADRLHPLANCDALLGHLKREALERVGPFGLNDGVASLTSGRERATAGSAEDSFSVPKSADSATASPLTDVSTTNVQEAGVDEPDIVKTDGTVVYALADGRLSAVRERGTPELLDTLAIDNPVGMLLDGDRLLVIGAGNQPVGIAERRMSGPAVDSMIAPAGGNGLTLTVVDVHDPSALRIVTSFEIGSAYVSARMVDGVVRIVAQSGGPNLPFVYPSDGSAASNARAERSNREVIETSTLADWLPSYTQVSAPGSAGGAAKPAYDCARTFTPPDFAGFGLLSVLTVDPSDPHIDDTTSVVADGQIVYASTDRLYVATNRWETTASDTDDVVSGDAATSSIAPAGGMKTLIHAFDISGSVPARYLVSGEVRGTVLNQFSLSAYAGNLRVATTDQQGSGSESFLTVLTDDGTELRQVGQVGGLGKGEQIKAVRFVGDRGYVVTFRQTDPLYVLDLADPAAPKVAGELKILGFSAYLHPLEGDLLLGVGQDADAQGRLGDGNGTYGVQVSLFDVSDPTNPKRLQQRVLGQSISQVGFDHHAFLYWPSTGLAVVPVQQFDQTGRASGAFGLDVSPQAIDEIAKIQHPASSRSDNTIGRSLVIGDRLVTVSASGLLSSDLATLQPGTFVALG